MLLIVWDGFVLLLQSVEGELMLISQPLYPARVDNDRRD